MWIYGCFLIPIAITVFLYKRYRDEVVTWEYVGLFVISIVVTFGAKALTESMQVSSTEYWGSTITSIRYYEPWDEYISKTCTTTDSKGNVTGYYDCSYVENHPAEYHAYTSIGEDLPLGDNQYRDISQKFGGSVFHELNRDYYERDGNMYEARWNGNLSSATPVTTVHTYENRIKASDNSVFHFSELEDSTISKYHLFEYPEIGGTYSHPAVLGDTTRNSVQADSVLKIANGILGPKKQVKMFLLVFKDQPIDAANYQEAYWSGGNKNEFILAVGIDKQRKVRWSKVISWTTQERLKVDVKNAAQEQDTLDLLSLAVFMRDRVEKEFIRRKFKEFSYITVEPVWWATLIAYLFTFLFDLGFSWYIVNNSSSNVERDSRRNIYRPLNSNISFRNWRH